MLVLSNLPRRTDLSVSKISPFSQPQSIAYNTPAFSRSHDAPSPSVLPFEQTLTALAQQAAYVSPKHAEKAKTLLDYFSYRYFHIVGKNVDRTGRNAEAAQNKFENLESLKRKCAAVTGEQSLEGSAKRGKRGQMSLEAFIPPAGKFNL